MVEGTTKGAEERLERFEPGRGRPRLSVKNHLDSRMCLAVASATGGSTRHCPAISGRLVEMVRLPAHFAVPQAWDKV